MVDILLCPGKKSTGVADNFNDGSVPFSRASEPAWTTPEPSFWHTKMECINVIIYT